MIRIYCTLILVSVICKISIAQQPEDHKKSTYTDSLGRFIVQQELPLYLYISTDPDQAPQRLNRSDVKGNEPIYLDGPGKHHIRHFDAIHHHAEVFDIYADGKAPVTKISFLNASSYKKSGKSFYGKNLTVRLEGKDDLSGVNQTYWSINKGSFSPYTIMTDAKEGEYSVSYYSVDNVGNVEKVQLNDFTVDTSVPRTYYNIVGIADGSIISTSTKIYLTATDSLSGISQTYYRFDRTPERVYLPKSIIPISQLSEGEHTLYYYSLDNVKNREPEQSISFFLDKTAPIMSADVLGDKFIINDRVYFSGRTKLKLTAVDNKSGVKEVMYSINNEPFTPYQDPFYLPARTGRHTIRYYAVDQMENSSADQYAHNTGIVYVDLLGPSLDFELAGSYFRKGDILFIGPECKVKLKAKDGESGVQYISYNIDDKENEIRYNDPFNIKESGSHRIYYYGYDNVNNRNAGQIDLVVDADGPESFYTFSVKRQDTPTSTTGDNYLGEYPAYVILYLAATDLMTGNAEIFYSINDQPEVRYTAPIANFVKGQMYSIRIKAKDKLGNTTEKVIRFKTTDY